METYAHFKLWGRRNVSVKDGLHNYEIIAAGSEKWQLCANCFAILKLTGALLPESAPRCGWALLLCFHCEKSARILPCQKLNVCCSLFAGIKPFQCDRCGKKFTRAYSLKMHRLKHEGKRCFRCQICSATFTSFGEYKHHMRVSRHIIRKPRIYECKTCGAMFTNSGNLIVHLRSLNHEASELANYFQSRWGAQQKPNRETCCFFFFFPPSLFFFSPYFLFFLNHLFLLAGQPAVPLIRLPANLSHIHSCTTICYIWSVLQCVNFIGGHWRTQWYAETASGLLNLYFQLCLWAG